MDNIEEKIDRVRGLLQDTEKWKGYASRSLERRALTELLSYYELLFKLRRETFEKSADKKNDEIRSVLEKGCAPNKKHPLSLYELIERFEKPVFTKDAGGRKAWKILRRIRMDEDGMMITWSDGQEAFISANDKQDYIFGEEVD